MKKITLCLTFIISAGLLTSCESLDQFAEKMARIDRYEKVSLYLSKENRDLKAELSSAKNTLQVLKAETAYLKSQVEQLKGKRAKRSLASVPEWKKKNDLVQFSVYKWTPKQMVSMAEKEFKSKNFEKSAQFYQEFIDQYPKSKKLNDQLLFQAGVAAFESKSHNEWAINHLENLVNLYPTSKYYRGAKLWMALTHLRTGKDDRFFATVEEFRKKYRNTDEWEILSHHYESIVQKYKRN